MSKSREKFKAVIFVSSGCRNLASIFGSRTIGVVTSAMVRTKEVTKRAKEFQRPTSNSIASYVGS